MDFEGNYTTERIKIAKTSKNLSLIEEENKKSSPDKTKNDALQAEINSENSKTILSDEAYIIAKLLNLIAGKP